MKIEIDMNLLTVKEIEFVLQLAKRKQVKPVQENNKKPSGRKRKRHQKRWNQDERKELVELYNKGWSTKRIAKRMNRTTLAIFNKSHELGLKRYKPRR